MLIKSPGSPPRLPIMSAGKVEDETGSSIPPPPECMLLNDLGGSGGVGDRPRRAGHRRGRAQSNCKDPDSERHSVPMPCGQPLFSVDHLRETYGSRPNFWGDLSAREARIFYKELLPESLRLEALAARMKSGEQREDEGETSEGCDIEALEELARLASSARHAARLYTRERCVWLPRCLAYLYDGFRHLWNYGSFR